jgi:predicted MFS family arabinose efflux permease
MMMIFATIIANNYVIFPYLKVFGVEGTQLAVPAEMWSLLKLGLSGYIVGRSAEKIASGSGLKGALNKVLKGSN